MIATLIKISTIFNSDLHQVQEMLRRMEHCETLFPSTKQVLHCMIIGFPVSNTPFSCICFFFFIFFEPSSVMNAFYM